MSKEGAHMSFVSQIRQFKRHFCFDFLRLELLILVFKFENRKKRVDNRTKTKKTTILQTTFVTLPPNRLNSVSRFPH